MKFKKRFLLSMLVIGVFYVAVATDVAKANEEEAGGQVQPTLIVGALASDPAFPSSSEPLHAAIKHAYPTIDGDGNGIITQGEAANYTGEIDVAWLGLSGTIEGIQYFSKSTAILLGVNKFTGEIPNDLWRLTKVKRLYLHRNELTGEIPNAIGNMTLLEEISFSDNHLSGTIPATLGLLSNLQSLVLSGNLELGGKIPAELGNLSKLRILALENSKYVGTLPESIYSLPILERVFLNGNPNLKGDSITGFNGHATLQNLNVKGSGFYQVKPTAPNLMTFSYDNLAEMLLDSHGTSLADGVTQASIAWAQENANLMPEGTKKNAWLSNIGTAKQLYDAKIKVKALFEADGTLKLSVTQALIDEAKTIVDTLPNGTLKKALQDKLSEAQKQINARSVVKKPSVSGGSNISSNPSKAVNTSDTTNSMPYVGLLATTMMIFLFVARKKQND